MKQYYKNPRKITDDKLKKLEKSINELGDLSGIVYDVKTDEIIAGNQRSKVIDIEKCKIELVKENIKPDKHGTMAYGYLVTPEKVRMNYREVQWTEEQREIANIAANKQGGEWDFEILETQWDNKILELGGFPIEELDLDPNFTPNTEPSQSGSKVSVEDIQKKQDELSQKFADDKKKIEVICPECTNEFQIDAK